jgi:hypothetical protein
MEERTPATVERTIGAEQCQRQAVDAATGEFKAVLATEGEASDGHILLMRGLEVPESMPLMFHHAAEGMDGSLRTLGTLGSFKKRSGALHATGRILVDDGEGEGLAFRRDVAAMVNAGGLPSMSIRWDTRKSVRRINLPKDNPHHVDAGKTPTDDPRYWGHLIEKSVAREGSIVALPADSGAMIERAAESASEESSAALVAMARELELGMNTEALERVDAAYDALHDAIDALRSLGVTDDQIAPLIAGDISADDLVPYSYTDEGGSSQSGYIPRGLRDSMQGESLRMYREAARLHDEAKRESVEPQSSEPEILIVRQSNRREREALRELSAEVPKMFAKGIGDLLYKKLGRVPKC